MDHAPFLRRQKTLLVAQKSSAASAREPMSAKLQRSMEKAFDIYIEIGTAGRNWIAASTAIAAASRKELVLWRWSRMAPTTISQRTAALKRWRGWLAHHPEWVDENCLEPSVPCVAAF